MPAGKTLERIGEQNGRAAALCTRADAVVRARPAA